MISRASLTSPLAVLALSGALVATGGVAALAAEPGAATGTKTGAAARAAGPEGTAAVTAVGDAAVRLSGADRYATAADVAQLWDAEGTSTVYLASGEGFADALAIGPSTYLDGPLLLVRRDELPAATAAELQRLEPCVVVLVGGTAAISDAVAGQAAAYADPARCAG